MKFFKSKVFVIISLILFCTLSAGFVAALCILPENITITQDMTQGKWIPKELSWFVSSKSRDSSPAMEQKSKAVGEKADTYEEKIFLCGVLPIKTVEVAVLDNLSVIPGGESIGINLKTQGVLCVGIAEFKYNGKKISPAKNAGVRAGDIFTRINGMPITKSGEFAKIVKNSIDTITLNGIRDNKEMIWQIKPRADDDDGVKKIGLWVRESVAGIGTVSFYSGDSFGALGHSITDIDTGEDVQNSGGTICKSKVIGVEKGEKGKPGSLMGVFSGDDIGNIISNTNCGVYGTTLVLPDTAPVKIASKSDVRPGKASIRCDIGSGKVETFDIEIIRITGAGNNSKNMIIKVTDKKLLSKTGGIVQGMSGSPIIQNDKLIGAVTHVFVNDPAKGYGIFIENMLNEVMKVK